MNLRVTQSFCPSTVEHSIPISLQASVNLPFEIGFISSVFNPSSIGYVSDSVLDAVSAGVSCVAAGISSPSSEPSSLSTLSDPKKSSSCPSNSLSISPSVPSSKSGFPILSIAWSISNALSSPNDVSPSVGISDTVSVGSSGSASKPAIGSVSSVGSTIEFVISVEESVEESVTVSSVGAIEVTEVVTSTESEGVSTSAVPLTSILAVSGSAEIASTIDL